MMHTSEIQQYIPRRSSPKFPQPIFLPTRKFGPTISTAELLEVVLGAALLAEVLDGRFFESSATLCLSAC